MGEFRFNLRPAVAVGAVPYGYTLTIWGSGAILTRALGRPHLIDVLALVAGAVTAFLALQAVAYGSLNTHPTPGPPPLVSVWTSAHFVTVGLALAAVWCVGQLLGGVGAWLLAGLLATAVFHVLNAVQGAFATRRAGG